jgi:hypothetical protein
MPSSGRISPAGLSKNNSHAILLTAVIKVSEDDSMLSRAIGTDLTVERQINNARTLLDRMMREMTEAGHDYRVVERGRNRMMREQILLRFSSKEAANAAEKWIDKHFDAD